MTCVCVCTFRQEDEVNRLISTVKQRGFQIRANFLCYAAYAYAQLGQYERFGRMVLLADKVGSPFFTMHLLWSYYYFVINGHKEQAAQVCESRVVLACSPGL